MSIQYHLGQRLSFEGALCSVRYIGPVEGTQVDTTWLGVEWDDPTRGKHSGEHRGKRYFRCLSPSQTAASFVRSSRPHDSPRSFVEALRSKYGAGKDSDTQNSLVGNITDQSKGASIVISGKTVEEVGFDKVGRKLASFYELKVVLLDGLCLNSANRDGEKLENAQNDVTATCPNIVELDLSRNLLENWQSVADICRPLKKLKILKVNSNCFRSFTRLKQPEATPFGNVQELYLEDCFLIWDQVSSIVQNADFPGLRLLSLSGNGLTKPTWTFGDSLVSVKELKLDFNNFRSLADLDKLHVHFPSLVTLSVQNNKISSVTGSTSPGRILFPTIANLSLSRNEVATWSFFDELRSVSPALQALQVNGNPIFKHTLRVDAGFPSERAAMSSSPSFSAQEDSALDSHFMTVVARLGSITSLNYSHITPQERMNAELYYLAGVEKEFAGVSIERLVAAHPRYLELCKKHDRNPIENSFTKAHDVESSSSSLAERLLNITFHKTSSETKHTEKQHVTVPKSIDVYRLKGLVSRKFRLRPLSFQLIYESDLDEALPDQVKLSSEEWDKISTSIDGKVDGVSPLTKSGSNASPHSKKETKLVNSTRELSYFLENDARDINIRIEID